MELLVIASGTNDEVSYDQRCRLTLSFRIPNTAIRRERYILVGICVVNLKYTS
jgi:hypothetical protein